MKVALVNPPWSFDGSIYFGCREPHLPLEFGYACALLEAAGHEPLLIDAQMGGLALDEVTAAVRAFGPAMTVLTTAPSYLFWRCPPPELRVPRLAAAALREAGGTLVVCGPHPSTTPGAALRKLGADVAILGECEDVIVALARAGGVPDGLESVAYLRDGRVRMQGPLASSDMTRLPALRWQPGFLRRHRHHHHRFDAPARGPGAEMEASRGCPYHCSFCAKDNYRDRYRRRPLATVLDELDGLLAAGVPYVYFIDEIFQPNEPLLRALAERPVQFGVQLRIDLWNPRTLALLGEAGCVSIEAGIESITEEGRQVIDKNCRRTTDELIELLITARRHVPFVQATLMDVHHDDPAGIETFRARLAAHGVWANKPVPLFPYPGSPDYARLWGIPDDDAWERAHDRYLVLNDHFSDVQDDRPLPLRQLESQG